jgi:hypothetical protein
MFWRTITGDMAVFSILGARGDFAVLPEPTGVYRVNAGGIYSGGKKPGDRPEPSPRELEKLMHIAHMFEELHRYLGARYDSVLRPRLAGIHRDIAWMARELGDYKTMRHQARAALGYGGGGHRGELVKLFLLGCVPWLLRAREGSAKKAA